MKVLIADGVSQEAVDILADFECVKKDKLSAEELLEIIPEFDALIVRSASKVTAEVIAAAKNLKAIWLLLAVSFPICLLSMALLLGKQVRQFFPVFWQRKLLYLPSVCFMVCLMFLQRQRMQ